MNNRAMRVVGYGALLVCTVQTSLADSRIKARYTSSGQSTETTILTKGARQRMEYAGEMSAITQCDLKRIVQIIEKNKSYLVMPLDGRATVLAAPPQLQSAPAAPARRGVITYQTSITDTGERKQLYGYTARHLKITLVKEPSAEACNQTKERTETDGWYIDYNPQFACSLGEGLDQPAEASSCNDEIRHNVSSKEKPGYPVEYTVTTYKSDGSVANTMTLQTLELANTPLDSALFEVPAGYSEVKMPQMSGATAASAETAGGSPASTGPSAAGFASEGPKQPGSIRVGVADVAARAGRPASTIALKEQLRSFIQDEKVDAVSLGSGASEQVATEAQQKQCDYVLYTDIAELKKGKSGGFGGLLSKASAIGAMGSGEPPKEKFEAKTDFKLFPAGGSSPRVAATATGKTGGGFSLKTAMSLASTAGTVASFAFMGGGMGFNPGMMNMFQQMNMMNRGYGSMGVGGMGIDPTSRFMTMMQAANPAMFPGAAQSGLQGPQLNPGEEEAVGESLQNVAKAIATSLKKK